jgi:hypothetical protein
MSRGHAMLTQRCFEDGAIAINVTADSVYPDGSIREAERLIGEGKHVVLCTAIRFDMDGVEAELVARGLLQEGQGFALSKRDAVSIGLRNLHAESRASNWSARNFGSLHVEHSRRRFLTCCFWMVEDGLIIVTHNWAPFAIDFTKLKRHDTGALDGRALDGNYIFENFSDEGIGARIHVAEDSDSLFLLGLTPRDEMVPPDDRPWWLTWPIISALSKGYILNRTVFDPVIDGLRRKLYLIPVRWHSRDITSRSRRADVRVRKLLTKYASADLEAVPRSGLLGWLASRRLRYLRSLVEGTSRG